MGIISNDGQYNVGKSKYKLLSSVSGPGSIITTVFGTHVLVSDFTKWGFVHKSYFKVKEITNQKDISKALEKIGIQNIEDYRFIVFLKEQYDYANLKCLIGISDMPLDDMFFTPKWKNHPIYDLLKKNGERYIYASDYMATATHFPKWFKNYKGDLKELSVWFDLWKKECKKVTSLKEKHFAPPKDAMNKNSYKITERDEDGNPIKIDSYKKLSQTYLVLVCSDGHLDDIPWSKYLNFKNNENEHKDNESIDFNKLEDCCEKPDLQWIENKTQSETIGNILIKCKSCEKTTNLEGLSETPFKCNGNKPWEVKLDNKNPNSRVPRDPFCIKPMRVVPVSARYLYFAETFSSIYIPNDSDGVSLNDSEEYEKKSKDLEILRRLKNVMNEENFKVEETKILRELEKIKNEIENKKERNVGESEYRFAEYKHFSKKQYKDKGLKFNSIELELDDFEKIVIVENLRLTTVQLGFRRINPENSKRKNIFSPKSEDIQVLPAIESAGEGLFFKFSKKKIGSWCNKYKKELNYRFKHFSIKPSEDASYRELKQEIYNNPSAFYLIHSFAHLLMKEFEFSCGYPAASLRERLYISKKHDMYGVLIYTTDGSEGSMGGLISQGKPSNLKNLIKRALIRSEHCSSDPLCWEETGQGIEKFNLSACFSCMLVSETSCEKMNLGLDRRILVDPEFGFFKHLLDN